MSQRENSSAVRKRSLQAVAADKVPTHQVRRAAVGKLSSHGAASHPKPRVLIADDDEGVRSLLQECLTEWGYEVLVTENGLECVKEFQSNEFELVITNFLMPRLNGIEVVKILKTLDKDIPVLLVSGHEIKDMDIDDEVELHDGYLKKPFELQDLYSLVHKVVAF